MSAMEDLMNEFDMEMTLQAARIDHEEIEGEFDEKTCVLLRLMMNDLYM